MYYGFDIGGTKIEFGAFDHNLQRVATERVATPTDDYSALLAILVATISKYDALFNCEGSVGIGIPGSEHPINKTVLTVNVPAATGKTLRSDLEARIGRSVALSNDANCFALSEAWDETLQDKPIVLGLIWGTGFGGGIVVEGKVLAGANNMAGEVGHARLPVDAWLHLGENAPLFSCGCGKKGCLDNYLSGRGFELLYQHFYQQSKKAPDIINDFRAGNPQEQDFVHRYFEMAAMALAGLLTSLDPDVVVLGGGLSNFDELYAELTTRLPAYLLEGARVPQIIKAKHGDAGGVRGAAFLNISKD